MRLLLLWSLCLLLSASAPSFAQAVNPTDVISSGTSYHIFAQPGEPTVEVFVLGSGHSGIYVVGASTTLLDLLALTGAGSNVIDDSEYVRGATVRLMREQGNTRTLVYERDFDQFLAEPDTYPSLQNGDIFTVEIKQRRRLGVRLVLEYASSLSSITLLVLRLASVF